MESPVAVGQPNRGQAAPKPPKSFAILEAVYVPGSPLTNFQIGGSAKRIPGGGNLNIEVHYTPNGKAVSDQTRIGFVLAKQAPQRRFVTLAPKSLANVRKPIPANASPTATTPGGLAADPAYFSARWIPTRRCRSCAWSIRLASRRSSPIA